MNKPELLAPAGSPEALDAAIEGGADAVYLGGELYSARASAVNFSREEMEKALRRLRLFGIKSYVALNTVLFDREWEAFLSYAAFLYQSGVNAVIVADLGAIRLLRAALPDLEIHASTQASVHSLAGATALANEGVKRVVLARELPLGDIRKITENAPCETEIFVHGALCVCHSGQCLFSSLVGGRSGNRGECAQPCRLPYNGAYPLSLKDMALASHVPTLLSSGVSSLKIEGRMKSPAYVFGVCRVYRRLLDEQRPATKEEISYLADLFSRGGFTDAYYRGNPKEKMTGVRSQEEKDLSRALPPPPPLTRKIPLTAEAVIVENAPASFTLHQGEKTVTVTGDVPTPARTSPLDEKGVKDRLSRFGGTDFSLSPADVSLTLGEGLNLSPGAMNALRREACAALMLPDKTRIDAQPNIRPLQDVPAPSGDTAGNPYRTALCFFAEQADALSREGYFDAIFLPLTEWKNAKTKPTGVYLPPVVFECEKEDVLSKMQEARDACIPFALCGNLGLWEEAEKMGFSLFGDFRFNITNRQSVLFLQSKGWKRGVLSPELSLPKIRDIGVGSVIVYGRIPLMLTERCFIRENFGCEKCNRASFTDRRGVSFPLLREYPHRNLILNSRPTYMGDRKNDLRAYGVKGEHFLFTTESASEAIAVLAAYREGRPLSGECRRIAKD